MGIKLDLTGRVFGRLTVLSPAPNKGRHTMWNTVCSCGNTCVVDTSQMTGGKTESCGCYQKEMASKAASSQKRTHGMRGTPTYASWRAMKQRTGNPNHTWFKRYGGRGITVDPRWLSFEVFFADMGVRPQGRSLERLDNDKGYSKENCTWATAKEQKNNTCKNRVIVFMGERKTVSQWADHIGMTPEGLTSRIDTLGWSVHEALTTPNGVRRTGVV